MTYAPVSIHDYTVYGYRFIVTPTTQAQLPPELMARLRLQDPTLTVWRPKSPQYSHDSAGFVQHITLYDLLCERMETADMLQPLCPIPCTQPDDPCPHINRDHISLTVYISDEVKAASDAGPW